MQKIEEECPPFLKVENDSPDHVKLKLREDDIAKSREFLKENLEWKVFGTNGEYEEESEGENDYDYELLEGEMDITHELNKKGIKVQYRHLRQKNAPKCVCFMFHGYEASLQIETQGSANTFARMGFEVIGFDQEGHGSTAIKHKQEMGFIYDYRRLYHNGATFINNILEIEKERLQNLPIFLWGLSMGGGAIFKIAQNKMIKNLRGVVAVAPAIRLEGVPDGILFTGMKAANWLLPKITVQTKKENDPISSASHFEEINKFYLEHKEVYKGGVVLSTATGLAELGKSVERNASKMTIPYVIFMGTEDKVVLLSGAETFVKESREVKDKKLIVIEDCMHNMSLDHCAKQVAYMSYHWVNERCK